MNDPLDKITAGDNLIGKIRNFLAGFVGYVDRDNRREADKLLRLTVAQRFEEQWERIAELQRRLIKEKQLDQVDDLEEAAIKLRAFVNRMRNASYGYSGLFDTVQINSKELEQIYEFDVALLEGVDQISSAVDNLGASLGTDGFPAAIRHLVTLSEEVISAFNRREEVILTNVDSTGSEE
ncbi:MAG: hypothetical protein MUO58_09545 [Anaerolineales bacterium]|nr:hypothetical protein [Anaerolineales bacterium]